VLHFFIYFCDISILYKTDFYSRYDFDSFITASTNAVCGSCIRFIAGKCQKFNVFTDKDDWGCDDFTRRTP